MTKKELMKRRAALIEEARALVDGAENGVLTDDQQARFDECMAESDRLKSQIDQLDRLEAVEAELDTPNPLRTQGEPAEERGEPAKRGIIVGKDLDREKRMAFNTLRMLHGQLTRNAELMHQAQRELAKDGWYGTEAQQRAAGDYYSTLVDDDGAILLPTVVAQEIERIGSVYGVAEQLATTFSHIVGKFRAPASVGDLTASAVAEGGEITSSKRSFTAVELNPAKWALIVPWSYEAQLEAGPQILADAQFAIGLGFARAKDASMFRGDGSATYNGIHGILSAARTGVATYTLPATKTSMDDITVTDLKLMTRNIPAVLRAMGTYVFHPDMEPVLSDLRDGDGRLLYAYNASTGVATLNGRPVRYTEVLPDAGDDAPGLTFGVFGAFKAWKIANGQGMTSEEMREGTVKDADTGTDINLGTQDLRALKVRMFWDMDCNFEEAFVKIKTAAN